jgi:hypothetical protein
MSERPVRLIEKHRPLERKILSGILDGVDAKHFQEALKTKS